MTARILTVLCFIGLLLGFWTWQFKECRKVGHGLVYCLVSGGK